MSKRCVICGIELEDAVSVCPKCGTQNFEKPVEPASPVVSETPAGPIQCVICGIMLDETISICPKCGSRNPAAAPQPAPSDPEQPQLIVEPVLPVTPSQPEVPAAPEKTVERKPLRKKRHRRKLNPRFLLLCGVMLALIVGIVLLVSHLGDTPTPEPSTPPTLIDNALALMNGNLDVLEQMAPDEYWEFVARVPWNKTKDEFLAMEKESYTKHFNNRDKQYNSFKVTGEIISEADMNEKTLQKTAETLFHYYSISESSVTAGKELTVQWSITTSNSSWKTLPEVLSAVEIDGVWYLVYHRDDGDYLELDFYKFSKQVKSSFAQ